MRTPSTRRRRRPPLGGSTRNGTTAALTGLVLALSSCASLGEGTRPASAPDPEPAEPTDSTGAEPPLLQIELSGGFVMMGHDFSSVPQLTVYPDGRAITHGPQIEVYPPPALPNLLTQDLSEEDLEAIVAAARDAGLLAEIDYGQPPVADAPTTSVTLRVDGQTYVHEAEALGIADGTGAEERPPVDGTVPAEEPMPGADDVATQEPLPDGGGLPGDEPMGGLTDEQRAARAALSDFMSEAQEIVGITGTEGEPYDIPGFAVMARPAPDSPAPADGELPEEPAPDAGTSADDAASGTVPAPDLEIERQVLPWPLDIALADAQDCLIVDGDAAATLEETLTGATTITLYEQDGVRYDVWTRPLLPHEETCDDVQ